LTEFDNMYVCMHVHCDMSMHVHVCMLVSLHACDMCLVAASPVFL